MDSSDCTRLKELFSQLGFLKYLKKRKFDILCTFFTPLTFNKGDMIIEKGQQDDSFFVIAEGTAKILVEDAQDEIIEARKIGEGNFLGEIALITGGYRTAWVEASEDVKAYRIGREALDEHLMSVPEIAETILSTARRRLIS
jgi:CRP-like cAMP-binding protein